ncbi:hypothetical protein ACF0H5_000494 [Mactra antiquata]
MTKIQRSRDTVEIDEDDLRWRRSSHAAITSLLPSHGALHSDTGLSLTRSFTTPRSCKTVPYRRKSFAAVREFGVNNVELGLPGRTISAPTRKVIRSMSIIDTWKMKLEERQQTVECIKSMTATIAVKKKYRKKVE